MIAEHNCDDLTQVNNERMNDNKSDNNNYMAGDLVSQQAMRELSWYMVELSKLPVGISWLMSWVEYVFRIDRSGSLRRGIWIHWHLARLVQLVRRQRIGTDWIFLLQKLKSDISLAPTSHKRWSNANLNVHNDKDGLGKGKERSEPWDDVADDVADHSLTGDNSWQWTTDMLWGSSVVKITHDRIPKVDKSWNPIPNRIRQVIRRSRYW